MNRKLREFHPVTEWKLNLLQMCQANRPAETPAIPRQSAPTGEVLAVPAPVPAHKQDWRKQTAARVDRNYIQWWKIDTARA